MKNLLRSGRRIWTDMIALILALVMIVIVAAQFSTRTVFYGDTAYDLSSGWVTEDGQSISLNEAEPGVVTLTHALSDMALTDKCLCLKTSDTFLDISIDGELVYHYAPTHRNVIGHSYGNYIHTIHLPADAQEVSMTLTPIYRMIQQTSALPPWRIRRASLSASSGRASRDSLPASSWSYSASS